MWACLLRPDLVEQGILKKVGPSKLEETSKICGLDILVSNHSSQGICRIGDFCARQDFLGEYHFLGVKGLDCEVLFLQTFKFT